MAATRLNDETMFPRWDAIGFFYFLALDFLIELWVLSPLGALLGQSARGHAMRRGSYPPSCSG